MLQSRSKRNIVSYSGLRKQLYSYLNPNIHNHMARSVSRSGDFAGNLSRCCFQFASFYNKVFRRSCTITGKIYFRSIAK